MDLRILLLTRVSLEQQERFRAGIPCYVCHSVKILCETGKLIDCFLPILPLTAIRLERMAGSCYAIRVKSDALLHYQQNLRLPDKKALNFLARAITISPMWKELRNARLVIKPGSRPKLAIFGDFDAAGEARIKALGSSLNHICNRLRYISYLQAERDSRKLAGIIIHHFGRKELKGFHFTAIPRGGYLVMGMLAYALNLKRSQLIPSQDPGTPLVIVDDCAFTGLRFSQFLRFSENCHVTFAHLYSHHDLRNEIVAKEPRVMACLSARDLPEIESSPFNMPGEGMLRGENTVLNGTRYWIGCTEHLCFPWSEPDHLFWNLVTECMESGWRIVPPELCLKNQGALSAVSPKIQVQPKGKGPIAPGEDVIFSDEGGTIIIGNLETGTVFSVTGTGAVMWRCIVTYGNVRDAAADLFETYDIDENFLLDDLGRFIHDLETRKLLITNETAENT